MKQFVTLCMIILCSAMTANAQTYLEHLKQKNQGQGVVTVNQSKAIDELVNGKQIAPQDNKTKTTPQPQKNLTDTQRKNTETQHKEGTATTQHKLAPDSLKKNETTKEGNHESNTQKAENKEETDMPVVDMRKKVMRKSYKVTGYRVQVYAGGNSRNDRLKAEQTGNNIKMKFPDQPVYVHF